MTYADRTAIVVGVDDSEISAKAALWAADLAHRMQVPLVVASAVVVPAYYSVDVLMPSEIPLFSTESAAGRTLVDDVKRAIVKRFPDLHVSTWCNYGPADLALVAWSRRAQLLVVGAHRHISVNSLIIGSTTARVINHSECPVVVWRGEPGPGPVVVGVDGSPLGALAVEHAFAMADRFQTGVRAVHAWDPGFVIEQQAKETEQAVLSESLVGWSEKYPDIDVTRSLSTATPGEALQRQALDARLVVVGSHGRGRATSLLLGSTSRYLLSHSPCPVLVCRSPQEGLA